MERLNNLKLLYNAKELNLNIVDNIMSEQDAQLQIAIEEGKVKALRQEVAEMNKEREYQQQVRTNAAIAAMQGILSNSTIASSASLKDIAETAVNMADALILKLEQNDKI